MTVATIAVRPGLVYPPEARARMRQITVSAFDRALARTAGRAGLVNWFDPASLIGGAVLDKASLTTWTLASPGSANPTATTIGGKPALQFTNGTSKVFANSASRANGSFSVITVRQQSSGEAATGGAVLWSCGTSLDDLAHARTVGDMRFFGNTGQPGIPSGHAAGTFLEVWSYDAATGVGAILGQDGSLLSASPDIGSNLATGHPMVIGGATIGAFAFAGKIGRVLVFDRALATDANAALTSAVLALLRAEYGL